MHYVNNDFPIVLIITWIVCIVVFFTMFIKWWLSDYNKDEHYGIYPPEPQNHSDSDFSEDCDIYLTEEQLRITQINEMCDEINRKLKKHRIKQRKKKRGKKNEL